MKTKTTKKVQLTFAPTIHLKFEVSEDQYAELKEIHDLSEFSDIEFLKSQFWGVEGDSQDLDLLTDLGGEIFQGECPIEGVMVRDTAW